MESSYSHMTGALAALASAFFWALAAVLFSQVSHQMGSKAINLAKGLVALVCLALVIFPEFRFSLTASAAFYLSLSGLIGIALGDTLYFLSLRLSGARVTLLIGTLIPVVTAVFAIVLFKEVISLPALLGLVMTIIGVTYVLWWKSSTNTAVTFTGSGILISLLFVLAESAGILLSKAGVASVGSAEATFIRQLAGVAGLTFWGLANRNLIRQFEPLVSNKRLQFRLLLSSFIGAFLGTWLSIIALKLTYASVAVALNSTSPLFVIPIAMIMLNEKTDLRSLWGSLLAVAGIMIYFSQLAWN